MDTELLTKFAVVAERLERVTERAERHDARINHLERLAWMLGGAYSLMAIIGTLYLAGIIHVYQTQPASPPPERRERAAVDLATAGGP